MATPLIFIWPVACIPLGFVPMSALETNMTADCKFREFVRRTGPSVVMMAAVVVVALTLVYKAGREAGMKTARARLD